MKRSQWEVIILKPTSVFLSFLAAHVPDYDLPELRLLRTDTTAYAIRKQPNEEETLAEIERHFLHMFKHEMSRWVGVEAADAVEVSFLDFLCCFKFELHSQIVLMEPSMTEGHHVLCIKPRSVLLKWMKSSLHEGGQNDIINLLERVNLAHLEENATVVVKNFGQLSDIKPFIQHYYQPIFHAEMLRMSDKAEQWPVVDSVQTFSRYFSVEIHTQLVHLH